MGVPCPENNITLYADGMQVYKSFNFNDCLFSILCVEKCVSDVKAWMTSNKLQMNEDKTDVLLVTLLNELLTCSIFQNS